MLQQAAVCHWQVGSFSSEVPEPRLGVVTGCAATGTRREMFCAEGKGGDPAGPSEQGRQQEGRAAAGSPQGCLQTPRTSSSSRIHRRKNKLIVSASCRSTSQTSGDLKFGNIYSRPTHPTRQWMLGTLRTRSGCPGPRPTWS